MYLLIGFAPSGKLYFEGHDESPVTYDYNMLTQNKNDRTLQGFSTDAAQKMKPCPHCDFYTDFFRFFQFYGIADYAHQWTLAALTGQRTVFDSSTADFATIPIDGRAGKLNDAVQSIPLYSWLTRFTFHFSCDQQSTCHYGHIAVHDPGNGGSCKRM